METVLPVVPAGHMERVCKVGQGAACCRYLVGGARGIECAKHDPELAAMISRRVEHGIFTAQGDNCEGWKEP